MQVNTVSGMSTVLQAGEMGTDFNGITAMVLPSVSR